MQSESLSGSLPLTPLRLTNTANSSSIVCRNLWFTKNEYPTTAVICGFPSSSLLLESNKSLVSTQSADKQVSSSTFNLAFVSAGLLILPYKLTGQKFNPSSDAEVILVIPLSSASIWAVPVNLLQPILPLIFKHKLWA